MGDSTSQGPSGPNGALIDDEYRRAMANLPDYVVLLDRDRRFRWVNRVAPGLTPPEVLGKRLDDFVAPSGVATAIATIEHTFETGEPGEYEVEAYGDGQTTRWYWTRVVSATVIVKPVVSSVLVNRRYRPRVAKPGSGVPLNSSSGASWARSTMRPLESRS